MITRISGLENDVCVEDIKDFNNSNVFVIDYNRNSFHRLEDALDVANALYMELSNSSINKELLDVIGDVVATLNNFSHFVVNRSDFWDTEKFVEDVLQKFDTFSYKDISEFKKESNISVYKAEYITENELKDIKDLMQNNKELATKTLANYFVADIEKGYINIISTKAKKSGLISIVQGNDSKVLINEYRDVLMRLIPMDNSNIELEGYIYFEVNSLGIYKEVYHLVNRYLRLLCYILNSTSFRENNYYVFDDMTIKGRMINLTENINYMKEYALNCINSDRRVKA